MYRFKSYPDDYEDPLKESKSLSDKELDKLWLFDSKGLCDYFTFRKNFVAVDKYCKEEVIMPIIKQKYPNEYKEVDEAGINTAMERLSGFYGVGEI